MLIRLIEKMDIDDIIGIESKEFDIPSTADELLNSVGTPSVVAQDAQGKVVGYCLCRKEKGEILKLYCIAVEESCRRKGIATEMVKHLQSKEMPKQRCITIAGNVHERRLPAQCFLRSVQFECEGHKSVDTVTGETVTALMFRYKVPFDNLSTKHLAQLARKSKKERVEKDSE